MDGLLSVLRIPDVHSRPFFDPFSLHDWAVVTIPHIFLLTTTRLALTSPKDPANQTIRLLLLPIGLWSYCYAVTFRDYAVRGPRSNVWNYGVGLFDFAAAMKLVEMTFSRNAPQRIVWVRQKPNGNTDVANPTKKRLQNGSNHPTSDSDVPITAPTTGSVGDIIHYLSDPRLLHYSVRMAKSSHSLETRDTTNRTSFLLSTFYLYLAHIMILDLCQTTIQSLPNPGIGTPDGGSIFNDSIPTPWRYVISSIAILCTGASVYCGLQAGYNMLTLTAVGLLHQDPAEWPPIFDKPWLSTSVRELWSKRWHLVLRVFFTGIGARVGGALLGDVGAVLGAFTLSGILHDWTIWGMGKGTDPVRLVGFFYIQGIAVLLETGWRMVTGKRVQGLWGRIWTWSFMLVSSHLVVEAWLQHGIAGGEYFLPDQFRPFLLLRNLLFGRPPYCTNST